MANHVGASWWYEPMFFGIGSCHTLSSDPAPEGNVPAKRRLGFVIPGGREQAERDNGKESKHEAEQQEAAKREV